MAHRITLIAAFALAAALASTSSANEGHVWICAVTSAVAVDEDGSVGPPDLGDKERATFLRVDLDAKEVTLLAPQSRRGEVTKIDSVKETDGQWLLSGVEHGRGVKMIITAEGRMSLSIVTDGAVWAVFGHVIPAADLTVPEAEKVTSQ